MKVKCLFTKIKDLGLTLKTQEKGSMSRFLLYNDKTGMCFCSLNDLKQVVNWIHREREV